MGSDVQFSHRRAGVAAEEERALSRWRPSSFSLTIPVLTAATVGLWSTWFPRRNLVMVEALPAPHFTGGKASGTDAVLCDPPPRTGASDTAERAQLARN